MPVWVIVIWVAAAAVLAVVLVRTDREGSTYGPTSYVGSFFAGLFIVGVLGGAAWGLGDLIITGGDNLPSADPADKCDAGGVPPPPGC